MLRKDRRLLRRLQNKLNSQKIALHNQQQLEKTFLKSKIVSRKNVFDFQNLQIQQTPNPEAQEPLEVPPFEAHSTL